MNVDHVADQLESQGHQRVQVRGLVDSAWSLLRKPYKFIDCIDVTSCAPTEAAKRSYRWDGGVFDKADMGLNSADAVKRRRFAFVQVLAQLLARCLRPGPRGRGVEVFLRT